MKLTRRLALTALLATAVLPTLPALAADKVQVGKSVAFAWTFTPLEVGVEKGFFAKHDLELEIISFAGDAKMQQGLASNSIQLSLGSGPGLGFLAKGVPAKGVAAYANAPLSMGVAVRADSAAQSFADLKGLRMGVTTVGSLSDWLTQRLALDQGWANTDIVSVPVGGAPSTRAAMETDQIDAAMIALEVAYQLENEGEWRVIGQASDYVDEFITHVVFATDDVIANNPDLVKRFLTGLWETLDWMKANKDEAVAITANVLQIPPEVIARTYDMEMPMFTEAGEFDPAAMDVLRQSFVEMQILPEAPADDVLLTTQFLPVTR